MILSRFLHVVLFIDTLFLFYCPIIFHCINIPTLFLFLVDGCWNCLIFWLLFITLSIQVQVFVRTYAFISLISRFNFFTQIWITVWNCSLSACRIFLVFFFKVSLPATISFFIFVYLKVFILPSVLKISFLDMIPDSQVFPSPQQFKYVIMASIALWSWLLLIMSAIDFIEFLL